jgi:hypothetical protein
VCTGTRLARTKTFVSCRLEVRTWPGALGVCATVITDDNSQALGTSHLRWPWVVVSVAAAMLIGAVPIRFNSGSKERISD